MEIIDRFRVMKDIHQFRVIMYIVLFPNIFIIPLIKAMIAKYRNKTLVVFDFVILLITYILLITVTYIVCVATIYSNTKNYW